MVDDYYIGPGRTNIHQSCPGALFRSLFLQVSIVWNGDAPDIPLTNDLHVNYGVCLPHTGHGDVPVDLPGDRKETPGGIIFIEAIKMRKQVTLSLLQGMIPDQLITMPPDSPLTDKKRCQTCGSSFSGEPAFCGKCGIRFTPVSVQQQNTRLSSPQFNIPSHLYTMFRANLQYTGEYDNVGIVQTNTELWRFGTEGDVSSSLAVANGVVYVEVVD